MSDVKLRDLERFKKTRAGLIEFAVIIEQASPKIRERLIKDVETLDPPFLRAALKKVVFFDELVFLEEETIAEILSHVSPKILAYALVGTDPSFSQKMIGYLDYRKARQLTEEQEKMGKVSSAMAFGAQVQILKTARELESRNKIVFELLDCPRFQKRGKQHLRLVPSK